MDYEENMGSRSHNVLLEITRTTQDSKKKLLCIKDNCHLVQINLRDLNQCSNLKKFVCRHMDYNFKH